MSALFGECMSHVVGDRGGERLACETRRRATPDSMRVYWELVVVQLCSPLHLHRIQPR